jgi:protein phosphatase-4 regulatory subunit 3
VYELREGAWFDRGTGRCKGIYDAQNDVALLVVEPEQQGAGMEESGGYVADEFLLNCHVSKDENYTKQQGESHDR